MPACLFVLGQERRGTILYTEWSPSVVVVLCGSRTFIMTVPKCCWHNGPMMTTLLKSSLARYTKPAR